jgi:hypothetical protein|tara:strand:+ start:1072 stop:1248 length:177 start_codon:yes stop_codon:yes gene_type:complete
MVQPEDIIDSRAMIGMFGLLSSITLQQVSTVVSILVGIVTFGYMTMKWYYEWKKIKSE